MRRFIDWFFRDRTTGAITIGQWPNLPLWVFALAAGAAWALGAASVPVPAWVVAVLEAAALFGLAWWAIDEVVRGVNPWRRCLGAAVLLAGLWRASGHL